MAEGSSLKKSSSQGSWLGNEICEGHIEALRHHRLLPPASEVLVRIPGAETAPTPAVGEVVVFNEHFYRGFGLPASSFFSEWLHFFGLQPHHLAPNAILQLSAFVVFSRCKSPSSNGQKGFFYVKNADPAQDALNMPPFNINPLTKLNWAAKSPKPIPEVA
ncbi:hypothetical protein D1007_50108 [Hordeum vulgare]|nr:hypothetical protein D1007_50108 [Hordeum vulgare]